MKKCVSVVMPVKNCEKFVTEAVMSILGQNFEDFEFIIINDGSTDSTKDILMSFDDKRISYLENRTPQGIIKSLNKAIYFARGEYIARMDADDISTLNRLERQINFFEKNPMVDILGSFVNIIVSKGEEFLESKHKLIYPMTHDKICIKFLERNIICHPTVMMKRKSLIENKLYYDRYALYAEDYKLWIDAILSGLVLANIDETLLHYRIHDSQTSNTQSNIQQYTANRISLGYAAYFFGDIINERWSDYFLLMESNPNVVCSVDQTISCRQLADELIRKNNAASFFHKSEFNAFISDKLKLMELFTSNT